MKLILQFFSVCLFTAVFFSCDKNEAMPSEVDSTTITDSKRYKQLSGDVPISGVRMEGDELYVTLTASGCDGSRWEARLVDSGMVAESYPVQRFAKIEFVNNEVCLAVISRTFLFDLKPLRVKGNREVIIHLDGWPFPTIICLLIPLWLQDFP